MAHFLTKDNYHNHQFRCEECFREFDGIQAPLETDTGQQDLWVVRCPNCGEPVTHFWKEEPDFTVITPGKMEDQHWALLESLQQQLRNVPELFEGIMPPITQIPKYISDATAPFHFFLRQFSWMEWHEGGMLTQPENAYLLDALPFDKAVALLYTVHRADRFNEGLLRGMVRSGQLGKLVGRVLEYRETGK